MNKDNIIPLAKSGKSSNDALTNVLRFSAQQLLMQAVEAKIQAFLTVYQDKRVIIRLSEMVIYLSNRSKQVSVILQSMCRGH